VGAAELSGSTSSRDWFARVVAVIGSAIGIAGLGLSYYNYRWQQVVYRESQAEMVFTQLSATRTWLENNRFSSDGELRIEITNIGLHPLYLKRAGIQIGRRLFDFYEYKPGSANEALKILQPSESTNFSLSWDFSEHPIEEWLDSEGKYEDLELTIETTKRVFSFPKKTLDNVIFTFHPGHMPRGHASRHRGSPRR
jgi:hypothetical protein